MFGWGFSRTELHRWKPTADRLRCCSRVGSCARRCRASLGSPEPQSSSDAQWKTKKRPLAPLRKRDVVRVKNGTRTTKAKVIEPLAQTRSYNVFTEGGRLLRQNWQHILPTEEAFHKDPPELVECDDESASTQSDPSANAHSTNCAQSSNLCVTCPRSAEVAMAVQTPSPSNLQQKLCASAMKQMCNLCERRDCRTDEPVTLSTQTALSCVPFQFRVVSSQTEGVECVIRSEPVLCADGALRRL